MAPSVGVAPHCQTAGACPPRLRLLLLLPALCASRFLRQHVDIREDVPRRADVLFVLHDAGETFALDAPMRRLAANGVEVLALVLGQPSTDAVRCQGLFAGCDPLPSVTLADLGVSADVVDGTGGRTQRLDNRTLAKVARALEPRLVVTGMNYWMQLQLGEAIRAEHGGSIVRFVAFFDGVRKLGSDSDVSAYLQRSFARTADQVWIPSPVLWPEDWTHSWRVVGQPTFDDWRVLRADHAAVANARRELYGDVAVASASPSLCWFGGYGPGYREALRAWCGTVRSLAEGSSPPWKFSLTSHPGAHYRDVDLEVLREEGMTDLVTVAPAGMSGKLVALASNLTASQGSTGGAQSIFAGKPALYLDPTGAFDNSQALGVLLGAIPTADSSAAAARAVADIAASGWTVDDSKWKSAGVPEASTSAVVDAVLSFLQSRVS